MATHVPFDFSPTVWWLPAETEMMFAQFEILHCPYVLYPTAEHRPLENTTAEWSPPAEIVDVVLRSAFMTAPTRRLIANVSMPVVLRNVEETGVEPDCLNASLSVGDGSTAIVSPVSPRCAPCAEKLSYVRSGVTVC